MKLSSVAIIIELSSSARLPVCLNEMNSPIARVIYKEYLGA